MHFLGILPSSQPDYYPLTGMTEQQAAEDTAQQLKAFLANQGVACQIFLGHVNSAHDAALAAIAAHCTEVISIHYDSGAGVTNGTLMLYARAFNVPFATHMLNKICAIMGHASRGLSHRGPPDGGHPWPDQITLPANAGIDGAMVECLDQSNQADAQKIKNPAWRKQMGQAIGKAYMEWIGAQAQQSKGEEEEVKFYAEMCLNAEGNPKKSAENRYMYNIPSVNKNWFLDISNEWDVSIPIEIWANAQDKTKAAGGHRTDSVRNTRDDKPGIHKTLGGLCPTLTAEWSEVSIHSDQPLSILVGN